ncbi:hypothetical protein F8568_013510 [Actinomadura sp. LD22]|uniref:Uncharacterized protein n=1 Tax=Actinomadura physcomitrii TaxID=2650748 RepID=A0A6I4M6I4_9ACTN|nr:hypothetical protein [Actinomadura physcomitrii]MWA01383.1 hypothetical protein [Actinomadura physcomitrii]
MNPGFAAKMRAALPELPDAPSPGQVEAWVELAELVGDPGFRAAVRRMAEFQAEESARGTAQDGWPRLTEITIEKASAWFIAALRR